MPSVFISYSHKDEVWKDRLASHLGVLEKQELLDLWDDRRIEAGEEWFEEIEAAIEDADVAVLLVSADFLNSRFILEEEIPRLLQRRADDGLKVFPVIVRPCLWERIDWLSRLQLRPKGGKPLAKFGNAWEAPLTQIAGEIYRLAEDSRDPRQRFDFLSRVEAVCRIREPGAQVVRIRRTTSFGPYLRITRSVGGITDIYPVGAVEHGLTSHIFQLFLDKVDSYYRKDDPGVISWLVYGGEPAPEDRVKEAARRRVRLVSLIEFQGLIDFRPHIEKQTRKLDADPVYPPRLYVPQRMLFPSGGSTEETPDALAVVEAWLASSNGRFVVLLGDFGTGKTFLLHELARRMGEEGNGLIPILLQMRSLEKGRSLDALLAQHFAQEGVEDFSPTRFRYMLEQGRVALLFDGFDELALRVTFDRATEHFDTLMQAASGAAKVVVTSRRQHFLSDAQVKTILAERAATIPGYRLAVLQPFDRAQIRAFLVNFCGDEASAEKRMQLIDHVKDLLGLSHNPRLLGFIAELPEEQLREAERGEGEITAARLYELLLQRWLVGEFERVHPKGAPPGLSVEDRWRGVTALALLLWKKTDASAGLAELTEGAAHVIEALRRASLDPAIATFQLGSGTLLVRDEDGNFSFLHQSILEWLVAHSAAEELKNGKDPESLAARQISPLMADFLSSLAGREITVAWARRMLGGDATESAKSNALLVLQRLKEEVSTRANLTSHDLRGKDLSFQDLTGIVMAGADLTSARLIETHLEGADLATSRFVRADLSGAFLGEADLSGADLTGARLLGTDLRGARMSGAILRRAKLLGSNQDSGAFEDCDTFGAALEIPHILQGIMGGRTASSRVVAWSPDGEFLASGSEDNSVRLWEVATGNEIRRFQGHESSILSIAFSPDGRTLASASNSVRLWEVATGNEIRRFQEPESSFESVAFSPDGKSLASGSDDKSVRLWEVATGNEIRRFQGHENPISGVAFSPDGKALASGSGDNTVRLWEIATGNEIRRFQGHEGSVWSVAFSPDGKDLARSSSDNTVRLWEVATGNEIRRFQGHEDSVWSVAFSPDGKDLASASFDNSVRLWEVATGNEIRRFKGHESSFWSAAFSPDGRVLASSSLDDTVRLWEVATGTEIRRFQGHKYSVLSAAFSPDGRALSSTSEDNSVRLWEVATGNEIRRFQGHKNPVAFSPDGNALASASEDNTVRLWEVATGNEIRRFRGHENPLLSVAFSPDGKDLASSSGNSVRLWKVANGNEIRRFRGHEYSVVSVAFSPDGKALASASRDDTVRLWEVATGNEIRRFQGHENPLLSVAFSPDGKALASSSEDHTVRLWEVATGNEIRRFQGHEHSGLSVAFSPDGKDLASTSSDNTVRLWEVATGNEIRRFQGHEQSVWSVAFSPDGKTLASGSEDNTIRLWEVATGDCLAILSPLPEGWVAFSPDGRYKLGGIPAGGFWHVINLCRFEAGELDDWIPGLRLPDDASFFDLPPWIPEVRRPKSLRRSSRD
jgi:WD40 repeat protein